MYYVIYVGSGKESIAEKLILNMVSDDLCDKCFHLTKHLKKKIRGKWTEIYECLIPGYIFVTSEKIVDLYQELKSIPMFLKLLGEADMDKDNGFYPLSKDEEIWLGKLVGKDFLDKNAVAELSQVGFDENDQVKILSGPLVNMEGQVKKINLHKRFAEVEVEFMGRKTSLHLGIEILGKKEDIAETVK